MWIAVKMKNSQISTFQLFLFLILKISETETETSVSRFGRALLRMTAIAPEKLSKLSVFRQYIYQLADNSVLTVFWVQLFDRIHGSAETPIQIF